MRLHALPWCVGLVSLIACRSDAPVRIGDALPRDRGPRSTIAMVQRRLDSLPSGPRVEIVLPDSGWLDDQVDQAYRFADDPAIVAVVGHAGSREALLGARVYNARHLPQIVPMATSHHLGQAGPWTFRLVPDDSVEGEVLAGAALDSLDARAITVFYEGDEYGIGLRDGVMAGLGRRGTMTVADVRLPEGECRDETSLAAVRPVVRAALRRQTPDLVVLAMHNELAACIMPLIDATLPAQRYLAGDGIFLGDPAIRSSAPRRQGRLWQVVQWTPDTTDAMVRTFVTEFRRATGRVPSAVDALTHDAYLLLAEAIRRAGRDREAIRDWLASLGRDRPAWRGVTGPITFTGERRELLRVVRVPGDAP